MVMAAYRASRHDAARYSPNFLMFGREVRAPINLVLGGGPNEKEYANLDDFVEEIRNSQEQAYSLARS